MNECDKGGCTNAATETLDVNGELASLCMDCTLAFCNLNGLKLSDFEEYPATEHPVETIKRMCAASNRSL